MLKSPDTGVRFPPPPLFVTQLVYLKALAISKDAGLQPVSLPLRRFMSTRSMDCHRFVCLALLNMQP